MILASGGSGNENYFWEYYYSSYWDRTYFGSGFHAGFYMEVYADPVKTCSFSGYVYEDLAEDGTKSFGDPVLENWRIFADQNGNGKLDNGEPNDVTNANGYYSISNVPVSSFDGLYQQTRGGWLPVNPESGSYHPSVSADGSYTFNFGNRQHGVGTIAGYKFDDSNANGVWDSGEPALQNWRIYIDENNNGIWDPTEPNDITNSDGSYAIADLEAPAEYKVAEVMQAGWSQTLPGGSGSYTTAIEPNAVTADINFGNTTQPVIKSDFTLNGRVDLADWLIMSSAWLTMEGHLSYDQRCDLSPEIGDGIINTADLAVFVSEWLQSTEKSAMKTSDDEGMAEITDI